MLWIIYMVGFFLCGLTVGHLVSIRNIKVLHIQEGDIIVISYKEPMSNSQTTTLRRTWENIVEDRNVKFVVQPDWIAINEVVRKKRGQGS